MADDDFVAIYTSCVAGFDDEMKRGLRIFSSRGIYYDPTVTGEMWRIHFSLRQPLNDARSARYSGLSGSLPW